MQGAGRAAWPFPASARQRRSAPASAARMFKLLFLDSLQAQLVEKKHQMARIEYCDSLTNLFNRSLCNDHGILCYDCLRNAIHRR
jgi:hypothetical protein